MRPITAYPALNRTYAEQNILLHSIVDRAFHGES